jgi:DNA mismatch repair protein MutS2
MLDEPDRRTKGPADGFAVGTRARMESGTVGEVLEVRGDGKLVLRVGSLKLVADPISLTPISAGASSARPPVRSSALSASSASSAPSASFELDLRGMTGDEAEQVVVAALDAAVLAEQPYLRIIHGKGTGVVRERVQQVLQRDRRVRGHAFAPANQGGTGVTVAEFAE